MTTTGTSSTPSETPRPEQHRVTLDSDPGALLAALPYLLGFRPVDSVVLIGHRPTEPSLLGWVLRGDLPPAEFESQQAAEMAGRLGMSDAFGATVVVVGSSPEAADSTEYPPHRKLVSALTESCSTAGLKVLHALWTPWIDADAGWQCYLDTGCTGTVRDPSSTPVAATVASTGRVTFDSREDMAELLTPDEDASLFRRAAALDTAVDNREGGEEFFDADCAAVGNALRAASAARLSLTDDQVVNLAMAVSDVRVRDACLATALPPGGERALAAETLWIALVRATPPPERAEPAALLAYSAYLRGDGAFARMALQAALSSMPQHVLAGLLDRALTRGITPDQLRGLGRVDGAVDLWRAG